MKPRNWITLGVIVLIVAGLGACRTFVTPAESETPAAAAEPGKGLPGILDFGRGECDAGKRMMPVRR